MSGITRRGLLGYTAGLFGLGACTDKGEPPTRLRLSADHRPPFDGKASFAHGIASGDPLSDRVIIWTRVTPENPETKTPIPVSYGVFADREMKRPVQFGLTEAEAGRDFTVKVDVTGLDPDTKYFFKFIARTISGEVSSPLGVTRTTAASGTRPVKLAVVSCSNFPFGYFNAYREIAAIEDLDAVVHLGDYIYEYGVDGYGGETGRQIGRNHEPPMEIVTLGDYRMRHAQYKSDSDLQAAHAAAPWFCTWDDHESTNNSYRTGAENHQPETEGNWSDRKQVAVQAYLEWMPVRDPEPGRAKESIYRKFEFGDVATLFCLESRLTGRSDEISWTAELGGVEPAQVPQAASATMQKVADPGRTMLGQVQEEWLAEGLAASASAGKPWQVLANQVIMAKVRPPNFRQTLSDDQIGAIENEYVRRLVDFSQLGLPWNLDAWDGFPAARERLYDAAKSANARLVTLTGDTHTAWANTLHDGEGETRGVEFGCTSITSPGFGRYMPGVDDLGQMFADANRGVDWFEPSGHGYTLVTLGPESVEASFHTVSTILEQEFTAGVSAEFTVPYREDLIAPVQRAG